MEYFRDPSCRGETYVMGCVGKLLSIENVFESPPYLAITDFNDLESTEKY